MKCKIRLTILYTAFIVAALQLLSCTPLDSFEKDSSIPNYEWTSNYTVKGSFLIEDTSASYNAYIVLRHTDAYRYNNIWVNLGVQPPADSMHYQKVNVQLGTDASGWLGHGMNDIWEVRQLHFKAVRFKQPGAYNFTINHIMRDEPLKAMMSAGFRLEKQ